MTTGVRPNFHAVSAVTAVAAAAIAVAGYQVAFATTWGAAAILPALAGLCLLGRLPSGRWAAYVGLTVGLAVAVPQLWFFFTIFGKAALPLWLIVAVPTAAFVAMLNGVHRRWGPTAALVLTPVLWTGLEFFRAELNPLRFAWLLPGQAGAFVNGSNLLAFGVYGVGFLYAATAAAIVADHWPVRLAGVGVAVALAAALYWPRPVRPIEGTLHVAGVQLEYPSTEQVVVALDRLAVDHPEADVLVLSEYTFQGPVPAVVREVVKHYHRYLVAGAEDVLGDGRYYDVAAVVGPDGRDVFQQAKSVPVQFMDDGLPAARRQVWASPWGPIGLAVCYDLSYARVTDDLVRQGARALIVPTMDLRKWGPYERQFLHGRMAPVRSAEYGIPTFGIWSSGQSQLTDAAGRVVTWGGYPGQGDEVAGVMDVGRPGRVPPDRPLAWAATVAAGIVAIGLIWRRRRTAPV